MYFLGFYSVPNLIVILFNLIYPIFVVGIYCKGCVIVRESMKTQAIEAKHLPHPFRVSSDNLVLLGSIGINRGWQM